MGLSGGPAAIGLALVAIVAASLLAGCQELGDNIGVANRTDVELHFVEVIGDKTYQLVSLPPGQSTALLSGVLGGSSLLVNHQGLHDRGHRRAHRRRARVRPAWSAAVHRRHVGGHRSRTQWRAVRLGRAELSPTTGTAVAWEQLPGEQLYDHQGSGAEPVLARSALQCLQALPKFPSSSGSLIVRL